VHSMEQYEQIFDAKRKEREREREEKRKYMCTFGDQWSSWIVDGELSKIISCKSL